MIKFLSAVLVLAFSFQASAADELKVFKRAALGDVGIGRKGYIHCERVENGVRLIRVGRDGVQRSGDHYVSRSDSSKIFVESKFKKKMAETASEDKTFLDTDFIRNKFLRARKICDDHKALQSGAALVRNKEPNDNNDAGEQEDQDDPASPAEQPESPAAPSEDSPTPAAPGNG